jgi:hypothetical protein
MFSSFSIIPVLTAALQMMFSVFGSSYSAFQSNSEILTDGYVCKNPVWVKRPQLKAGSLYLAAMSAECTVYPQLGGDLEKLQTYTIEQIRKEATVERGPIDGTFEGLPSKYLDATMTVKADQRSKDSVTIKQDVNLATDKTSKLIWSSVSRNIVGSGNGAYLKKMDTRADVNKTSSRTEDSVVLSFYSEMEKPWFAPEGMFLNQMLKRMPEEFEKLRDRLVGDMSKNY